jgi:hypothetical protein
MRAEKETANTFLNVWKLSIEAGKCALDGARSSANSFDLQSIVLSDFACRLSSAVEKNKTGR